MFRAMGVSLQLPFLHIHKVIYLLPIEAVGTAALLQVHRLSGLFLLNLGMLPHCHDIVAKVWVNKTDGKGPIAMKSAVSGWYVCIIDVINQQLKS
jgi:hypothetical protein